MAGKKKTPFAPRKPEFYLVVSEGVGSHWNRVGAAWVTDKGALRIKLNTGTHLVWDDGLTLLLVSNEDTPPPPEAVA